MTKQGREGERAHLRWRVVVAAFALVMGCRAEPAKSPPPVRPAPEPPPDCAAILADRVLLEGIPSRDFVNAARSWGGFAITCEGDRCREVEHVVLGCVRSPPYASIGEPKPDGMTCCGFGYQGAAGPVACTKLVRSWEAAVERVPAACRMDDRVLAAEVAVAEVSLRQGFMREAEQRFWSVYERACGVSEAGYWGWQGALVTANLQRNTERSRTLAVAALARSCAMTVEQELREWRVSGPTQGMLLIPARRALEASKRTESRSERRTLLRRAAASFSLAVEEGPQRYDTPNALSNAGRAFDELGEPERAIALIERFLPFIVRSLRNEPRSGRMAAEEISTVLRCVIEIARIHASLLERRGDRAGAARALLVVARDEQFDLADRHRAACDALQLDARVAVDIEPELLRDCDHEPP